MAGNGMFRTVLFGGFNKDDVDEYIKTLEHEMESIKLLHQKEKNELLKKLENGQTGDYGETEEVQELQDTIRILRESGEKLKEENMELMQQLQDAEFLGFSSEEAADSVSRSEYERLQSEKQQIESRLETLQRENEEVKSRMELLQEEKTEIEGRTEAFQENSETGSIIEDLRTEKTKMENWIAALQEEKAEMEKRTAALQEEKTEMEAQIAALQTHMTGQQEFIDSLKMQIKDMEEKQQDNLFDYDAVSRIMEEARNSAAEIEKRGRIRAEEIIEEAKAEAEKQKDIVVRRINSQLEEKGIQLIAAKYKLEEYAKEIESTQRGLCSINARIQDMARSMPIRLDDYWEGEHYRELESQKEQKGIAHNEQTAPLSEDIEE